MKSLKIGSFYAVASAAAIGIAACAGESAGPGSMLAPTAALRHAVGDASDGIAQTGHLQLCKEGNVDGTFTISRTPFGPASDGVAAVGEITVAAGECKVVATDVSPSGSASDIVINETSAGFVSASYVGTDVGESGTYTNNTTSLRINPFHGYVVTYVNHVDEDVGCTYTQGWYKNPKHVWPGPTTRGTAFDGGASYESVLNTPPKGNVYYILAHQYIAALLNIEGGASSSDITQELSDAADYFADATVASPLPAGWTKEEVTALAAALDDFNNGVTGPGHCDDEVLAVQ
jgi:hypothetical protein